MVIVGRASFTERRRVTFPNPAAISQTPEGSAQVVPFWAAFLVFVGIVGLFGLAYSWRYQRIERRQEQGSPKEREALPTAEATMTPSVIARADAVEEWAEALSDRLQGKLPRPASAPGQVSTPVPPADKTQERDPQRGP